MAKLDHQQERMLENQWRRDVRLCLACGAEITEQLQCERCKGPGCRGCLKENDVGEMLCEECSDIENDPQIKAAQKAAHSGSYHDLHKYVEQRKHVN